MPLILTEPLWAFARLSSKGSLLLWALNQPAFPVSLIDWEWSRTELYSCRADHCIWCYWQKIWVNQRQCRYFGKTWLACFQILSWVSSDLGGGFLKKWWFQVISQCSSAVESNKLFKKWQICDELGTWESTDPLFQILELEATCNFLLLTSIK